jgi:RND family efflux transporter MFP subunit
MGSERSWWGLMALGLGCCWACAHKETEATVERAIDTAQPVTVGEVVSAGGPGEVLVPALVQARERAVLSARIAASIVQLPHAEGDVVAAGALLVRLDDSALRSAVAAAEAAAAAADVDLLRNEALLAKDAATPRELDDARVRAAASRAALSAAQDALAYASLRAPFAGRVAARPASLGDVAAPGRPLIEIEGALGMEVRASVESELLGTLRPGQSLRALVDGQPRRLNATLRVLVPAADPATHRSEIRADLPSAAGLRAGLFARLALPHPSPEARLLVPSRAVFTRGGLVGVFVIREDRARLRWIAVGSAEGDRTEVRAGLEAGEQVALEPDPLGDGVRVAKAR